jgi:hydrogenase maturation protease
VDAARRGGPPGTLYVLEPDETSTGPGASGELIEPHGMGPLKVLELARAMGGPVGRLLVVGCEPAASCGEEMEMEMSEPVRAAVEAAVPLIEGLVARLLRGDIIEPCGEGPITKEVQPCREC